MQQIKYEEGILFFKQNGRDYKSDYGLNIERLDGGSCVGEFSKKDKVKIAQRLVILKAISEGIIKEYSIDHFNFSII